MFGYIIPDKPHLMLKDYALYRSLYCGICVATGKRYGQFARLTTNYDVTFLSALLHNYLNEDIVLKNQTCALHRIKKRTIAQPDAVTDLIAGANVILVYYNLTDDILDEGSFKKRIARGRVRRAHRRAAKRYPGVEQAVRSSYEKLRKLEAEKCTSIDRLADSFAGMMRDIAAFAAGEKACEDLLTLAYDFGKWVYLIDAVDDLEKDFKRKQFNPFLSAFGDYITREKFLEDHREEVEFSLNSAINGICQSYAKLNFPYNHELTDNIVYRGIGERTRGVLSGEMAGKTPKI